MRRSISRMGCATCRRRKVRCDERRGVCGHCSRLGLACEWYPASDIAHRSRVNTACERCRRNKIRCTATASSTGPCAPCQAAMADCLNTNQGIGARSSRSVSKTPAEVAILSPAPARTTAHISAPGSGPLPGTIPAPMSAPPRYTAGGLLPDEAEQRRLLDVYFDGPHYFCFYTFVHPPTLMQMFDGRAVPDFLLLIVLATALRFLEPRNRRADAWADECRRLVMLELFAPPSTTTLQALLLLQRFEWHRASHVAAWFVSGLAVRLAHGLQLNLEIATDSRVPVTVREARRRLVWSCFVMESLIENGRRPLASLDAGAIEVRLPCSEQAFQLGLETDMPTLGSSRDLLDGQEGRAGGDSPSRRGISTFLVQLAALRRAILDYTMPYHPRNKDQHIANATAPVPLPWVEDSPFYAYEDQLHRWSDGLPPEMRFSTDMLYRRRSSQLVSFVTLHCLYHGCYCDLYRIGSYVSSLHRLSSSSARAPPADFLTACRRGRVQHALAICSVLRESRKHQPAGHDPVVGISASLALRVLVIERQRDEDAALGLTEPSLGEHLDAAVACGKEIARRSIPIRDLFCSVCELARKHDFHVDLSDIQGPPSSTPKPPQQHPSQDRERAASPSLRTYGTFGRIQDSLACRRDVLTPAASTATDKESDLFHITPVLAGADNSGEAASTSNAADESTWRVDGPSWASAAPGQPPQPPPPTYGYPAYETYSPNELGVASAWGDGTLNFSMTPTQFDWISQSLGFDLDNGSGSGLPPYGSESL